MAQFINGNAQELLESMDWSNRFFAPYDPGCRIFELKVDQKLANDPNNEKPPIKSVLVFDGITDTLISEVSPKEFKELIGDHLLLSMLYYDLKFKTLGEI